ncbi:hypothetical protein N8720_04270 [Candidatus Marinimicrobia bacterium]|nr:hypothetical protein [Candidatus Neomarinimicrobiota bacterium]
MSDKNFPHPVLGISNDYNKSSIFEIYFDSKNSGTRPTGEIFYHDLKINLKNKTLEDLIKKGDAVALCEISCPATLFSRFIPISFDGKVYEISPDAVFGQIKLTGKIIALKDLNDFNLDDLNEDFYSDELFNIKKYDIIAFSQELSHNYSPKYIEDTLMDDKTLFQYKRAERPRDKSKVYLTSHSVDFILSHKDFAAYENLRNSNKEALNSMIFLKSTLAMLIMRAIDDTLNYDWKDAINQAIEEFDIRDSEKPQINTILTGVDKILKRENITLVEVEREVNK